MGMLTLNYPSGGAGNVTRKNLDPKAWEGYSSALLNIHRSTSELLSKGATALDAATHAVVLLEDCSLFNCGRGAVRNEVAFCPIIPIKACVQVFTRSGTIELEASVSKFPYLYLLFLPSWSDMNKSVHCISTSSIRRLLNSDICSQFQMILIAMDPQ